MMRGLLVTGACAICLLGCVDAAHVEQASQVCSAVDAQRFAEALSLSTEGASATGPGRDVAECRCIALASTDDTNGCLALLDPLLRESTARDWVPHPGLTKLILRAWHANGERALAADLARRAAPIHRGDVELLQLELAARTQVDDETAVFADIESRLDSDPSWAPQRVVLSLAWSARGLYAEAVRVLGDVPPPIDDRFALPWYEARIAALAKQGDGDGVRATFDAWRATGWDPNDLAARYALRVSVDHLEDPEHHTIDLLRAAVEKEDSLRDRNVAWGLYRRLIGEYLAAGHPSLALEVYDTASARVPLEGITRGEIERAIRRDAEDYDPSALARLRLVAPKQALGGSWWLDPGPEAPPDAGYRAIPIIDEAPQKTALRVGAHPTRWVLTDAEGHTRASGSVWPEPGAESDVVAAFASAARDPSTAATPGRRPADGRRRVFAILADCGDWRLTEYLRKRGDLPFHDHLFSEGHRAVLESRPAFTAAAMQALVWPAPPDERPGALARIHELGLELAGLESIGRNPVGFLSWLLPERPNLFDTLGAGPVVTANMLLTHGKIDAGRHAELVGPHGARESLPAPRAYRVLTPEELSRHPDLDQDPNTRKFAQTIAAEMDAAEGLAREGRVDFLFLRLEALDLITHGGFSRIDGTGQDDGRGALLSAYRYIDERLAALDGLLDEDDWLVFLSDHGIRSAMQHEEDAIFVVVGEGVPAGRADGTPALRGVPKSLAAMLGVPTTWPDTGATAWLRVPDARMPASSVAHRH